MGRQINIGSLHDGLESLSKPFGKAIGGRMIRCRGEMPDVTALQELRELFTVELWPVVAHELLSNSVKCEQGTENLNGVLGGG